LVQVKTNRNPTPCSKISRHKEAGRIFFDEAPLVAQARLAGESDNAVAMMVKEIVRKDPLADAKGQVRLACWIND